MTAYLADSADDWCAPKTVTSAPSDIRCVCGACGVRHCLRCGDDRQLGAVLRDGLCPTCRRTERCGDCGRPIEPGEACCDEIRAFADALCPSWHCLADGPTHDEIGSTCLLPDGHAGPHRFTRDDEVQP